MLAVAVTTAPRPDSVHYLPQSLVSLRHAGFTQPVHIFAEPRSRIETAKNQVVHRTDRKLGCFQNWARAAAWGALESNANWVLLLQDDCLWRNDAAARIQEAITQFAELPTLGFLSPYTSKAMLDETDRQVVVSGRADDAWRPVRWHNNAFWGAVATLWRVDSLRAVLQTTRFTSHTHQRKVDVVIGNCCKDLGLSIFVHRPSLATHVGKRSTLGRDRITGIQWGRYGFGYRSTR